MLIAKKTLTVLKSTWPLIDSVHKALVAVKAGSLPHKESGRLLKETSCLQNTLKEVVN